MHINLVQENTEVIGRHKNWDFVLFKETLKIKYLNSILNPGLKVSKEPQEFLIHGNITYTWLFKALLHSRYDILFYEILFS